MNKTIRVFGREFHSGMFILSCAVIISTAALAVAGATWVITSSKTQQDLQNFQSETIARRKVIASVIHLTCTRENKQAKSLRKILILVLKSKPKNLTEEEKQFYATLTESIRNLQIVKCSDLVAKYERG